MNMNVVNHALKFNLYQPVFKGNIPCKANKKNEIHTTEYNISVYDKPSVLKTVFGTIRYLKNGKLSEFEFNKALSLQDALEQVKKAQHNYNICGYGLARNDSKLDSLANAFDLRLKKMKFTKFLGAGGTALALENQDGNVVKLCFEDQFKMRQGSEEFDAPVYRKGNIYKRYFYYVQEKCSKEGIAQKHVDQMEKRIIDKGYIVTDLFEDQIGFGKDGKIYLLDPQCAHHPLKESEFQQNDAAFIEECIRNGWM